MSADPKVDAELQRLEAQRREAARLAPQAVDLSAPRPRVKRLSDFTPEQLGQAEREARGFLRSLRRLRQAGRIQHGKKHAIPQGKRRRPR